MRGWHTKDGLLFVSNTGELGVFGSTNDHKSLVKLVNTNQIVSTIGVLTVGKVTSLSK